jgi:nitroreductase
MNIIELSDLIKSRRSNRVWQDKPVPEELLCQAVDLATYAPNAGNKQNWKFYIILKNELIVSIAGAVQNNANYLASLLEPGPAKDNMNNIAQKSGFFQTAPAVIAVASSQYQSPIDQVLQTFEKTESRVKEIKDWRSIANSRIQSVSSAIAYLLLIFHGMGLGAVWMTGPIQAKEEIEKMLKVPPEMDLIALIPVGYPAEVPPSKARKEFKEVCEVIK